MVNYEHYYATTDSFSNILMYMSPLITLLDYILHWYNDTWNFYLCQLHVLVRII